ncbi:MAG: agmatinase [Bacillota bacterium]|jgi:agmatinase
MKNVDRTYGFSGSCDNYQNADIAILGIPMDFTVSFRTGTRFGPQCIRNVSVGLEDYSCYIDKDLRDKCYYDCGDLLLPFGNVDLSLKIIEDAAQDLFEDGKFPIFIGGEHLVTYPLIKAAYKKYPDLAVIHFDAHADLRMEYMGEKNSHATVIRRIAELLGGKNIYQFGIRSGDREEISFGQENTHLFIDRLIEPLKEVIPSLKGRPVYITLDIDVVDPAFAPGTGTPEPGGCTSREIIQCLHMLGELNVVGFDLVEVLPGHDLSERTSILAAKLIREAMLTFC